MFCYLYKSRRLFGNTRFVVTLTEKAMTRRMSSGNLPWMLWTFL